MTRTIAIALLFALTAHAAPSPTDARAAGLAAFRANRFDEARRHFLAALNSDDSALLHFNLASACYKLDDFATAEAEYRRAADLDDGGALSALALLDAGLAADGAGRREAALELWRRAAIAGLGTSVAVEAEHLIEESTGAAAAAHDRVWGLVRRGRDQLKAGDFAGAAATLLEARDAAVREGLPVDDRVETEYALGHALRAAGRLDEARTAFAHAVELAPADAEARLLLGEVLHDLGRDAEARVALQAALDGGLTGDDRARAAELLAPPPPPRPRVIVDAEVAGGYDSNYAGGREVLFSRARGASASDLGSPEIALELEPRLRLLGRPSQGLYLGDRASALFYTAAAADAFNLLEDDLYLEGSVSPTSWLTLAATVGGYLQTAGVAHFGLYQTGLEPSARVTFWEGEHLATRLRYFHAFMDALDPSYAYLSGDRDLVTLEQIAWLGSFRIALSFGYRSEAVGRQVSPAAMVLAAGPDLALRCAAARLRGCTAMEAMQLGDPVYQIGWSYQSQSLQLSVDGALPGALLVEASAQYEHRDYGDGISITPDPRRGFHASRVDDRAVFTLGLRREIGWRVLARLDGYLLVNRSSIDNTQSATPFDFDDKNYLRVVATIGLSRAF